MKSRFGKGATSNGVVAILFSVDLLKGWTLGEGRAVWHLAKGWQKFFGLHAWAGDP